MDKFEYKVRADEIKTLISQGEYGKAADLADSIDWSRVKKPAVLCTISDLYKKNRRYDDAIELMQLAYDRNPGSKDIIYSLCGLYIKTGNIIKAVSTYKEFAQVASTDVRRYILQYKIYEMQDISLEERIEVLEELKNVDYREKWGYTLAYLYHRVGLATKCVEECDELILWFGDGAYVYKAMELKMLHQPLTPAQQEKYDHRFDAVQPSDDMAAEMVADENSETDRGVGAVGKSDDIQVEDVNPQNAMAVPGNAEYVQYGPDGNVQADTTSVENDPSDYDSADTMSGAGANQTGFVPDKTIAWTPIRDEDLAKAQVPGGQTTVFNANPTSGVSRAEAIALSLGYTQVYHGMQPEPEIEVKTIDVGEYNTINLQKAIAEGVAEVLGSSDEKTIEGVIKADTKEIPKNIVGEDAPADDVKESEISINPDSKLIYPVPENTIELMSALNMQQTVEIASVTGGYVPQETIELSPEHTAELTEKLNAESAETADKVEKVETAETPSGEIVSEASDDPALKFEKSVDAASSIPLNTPVAEEAMSAQPPEQIASVLKQEPDGQISLVIPEDRILLVKQITGQMNINDVMAEWGRMKREHEEYNRQQYHQQVLQQTGEIFNEFERAALNGVLEQLEAEALQEAIRRGDIIVEDEISEEDYESAVSSDEIGPDDQVEELEEIKEEAESASTEVYESATINAEESDSNESDRKEISSEAADSDESGSDVTDDGVADSDDEAFEELEEIVEDEDAKIAEALGDVAAALRGDSVNTVSAEKESEDKNESSYENADGINEFEASGEDDGSEGNLEFDTDIDSEPGAEEQQETPHKRRFIPEFSEGGTASFRKNTKKMSAVIESEEEDEDDDGEEVRALTPEEMSLFGPYAHSKSAKKQLAKVIDSISLSSYTGNVVITGGDGNDVSSLATTLMKNVKQSDSNFSGKVAAITGKKFNGKKVGSVIKQLANGGLIIEKASGLDEKTAIDLYKCLDQDNLGIVIVLLDTKKNIDKLFELNPKLAPLFNARMNIKALSAEQLANYAVKYAYEKEFSIDEMGMLALHRRIEARQTATHSVNIIEVREIVDEAIAHVKKKTIGHFFETLSGKRYDSEDMIILGEKDFA